MCTSCEKEVATQLANVAYVYKLASNIPYFVTLLNIFSKSYFFHFWNFCLQLLFSPLLCSVFIAEVN